MIQFSQDKEKLVVQVEAKTDIAKRWYTFTWDCSDEIYAELLVKNLNEHCRERLKAARQKAYEQGGKDAKAKHKKETWFGGWF